MNSYISSHSPRFARILCLLLLSCSLVCMYTRQAWAEEERSFVGSGACESCHEEQYESFQRNSNKAHSWKSVEKMLPKLTESEQRDCFSCHTTGYGQPGGFKSMAETPELANLSCEACHGPGSLHAESGDPDDITRTPDSSSCVTCHNGDRIQNFNFKPMLYHGGH